MIAGLPGTGIGGLFYLLASGWMAFSSRARFIVSWATIAENGNVVSNGIARSLRPKAAAL